MHFKLPSIFFESPICKYVYHPICKRIVDYLPHYISANIITFSNMLLFMLYLYLRSIMPSFGILLTGITLCFYALIDDLDGFVARKNNQCSQYGLWFDHTLDSFVGIEYVRYLLMTICESLKQSHPMISIIGGTVNMTIIFFLILIAFITPNIYAVKKGSTDHGILFFGVDELFLLFTIYSIFSFLRISIFEPYMITSLCYGYIVLTSGIIVTILTNLKYFNLMQFIYSYLYVTLLIIHYVIFNNIIFIECMYTLCVGYVLLSDEKGKSPTDIKSTNIFMLCKKILIFLCMVTFTIFQFINIPIHAYMIIMCLMFLIMRYIYLFESRSG